MLVTFQADARVQSYNPLNKQTFKRKTLRNEAINVAVTPMQNGNLLDKHAAFVYLFFVLKQKVITFKVS